MNSEQIIITKLHNLRLTMLHICIQSEHCDCVNAEHFANSVLFEAKEKKKRTNEIAIYEKMAKKGTFKRITGITSHAKLNQKEKRNCVQQPFHTSNHRIKCIVNN